MTLTIVIPMAGAGSRFQAQDYSFPKPLIQMPDDNPMIKMVIDCVGMTGVNWHFITREQDRKQFNLDKVLPLMVSVHKPNKVTVSSVSELTEGAACTILSIRDQIDNDEEIAIVNSDQYFLWDPKSFYEHVNKTHADGALLTFDAFHPMYSFAAIDDRGYVTQVAEKDPISSHATAGMYWWRRGADFVKHADEMIASQDRVNNEFYVAPVYNYLLRGGGTAVIQDVKFIAGAGTPELLRRFEIMYWLGKVPLYG